MAVHWIPIWASISTFLKNRCLTLRSAGVNGFYHIYFVFGKVFNIFITFSSTYILYIAIISSLFFIRHEESFLGHVITSSSSIFFFNFFFEFSLTYILYTDFVSSLHFPILWFFMECDCIFFLTLDFDFCSAVGTWSIHMHRYMNILKFV